VLNELDRLMIPCTSYPFSNSSSARYEPSCPDTPVSNATFLFGSNGALSGLDDCRVFMSTTGDSEVGFVIAIGEILKVGGLDNESS